MTTSPTPQPSHGRIAPFRSLSLFATATAVSLAMLVALAATTSRTAGATEFYSNPTLSALNSCEAGEYHYEIGLYNFAANDSTVFTVEVTSEGGPTETTQHTILGGDLEWLDIVVPEATTTSFHVTNDDDPTIDWIAAPRADCVADAETQVVLECHDDGTGASVRFDWVNTSYTSADFLVHLPDGSTQPDTLVWADGSRSLSVPVAEGDHVLASIDTDGVTTSAIDEIVDCVPESTTTSTLPTPPTTTPTVPTTVPDATIPDATVPSTDVPVVLTADEVRDDGLLDPAAEELGRTEVENSRADGPVSLAFTGAETGWLAALGTLLLAAGLVSWTAARRRRQVAGS